ncbi:Carboxypeptidase [Mycena indigotica]|uniref:Carboxypeptidase n=1 Tax=Mycena indigotica TaxID=2126181 RepID=A0A8H6W8T6_9AGAR|nr:Carboxypeptidase [Mycena indigotica]KAF7309959.1 Carboxypeptidase [Mycena indigotica]
MRFFTWTASTFVALPVVLAGQRKGQFPVVDGVIGGVRNNTAQLKEATLSPLATTPGKLRVTENSGICETTKGVYQASGYGDLTSSKSIFFWYFDARNNASTAPLSLWFNGGPGSSSMYGLVQELGPCRITNNSKSVTLNDFSWNVNSNLLVIDQPVGAGFSHGTTSVGTSQAAAADVWSFLQIFLADSRFSRLTTADVAIWTESYGGHYGPAFATYFLSQNSAIAAGTVSGVKLNLKTLGIGNGLTDAISQYPGYISYATSNPYGALVSTSTINRASSAWSSSSGCKAQITACNNGGSNSVCSAAQSYCNNNILSPLVGNHDIYYVPAGSDDPYPADITSWLASVRSAIGAEVSWAESSDAVYNNFASTGDWMRSQLPNLNTIINAGIRVTLYNGDADFIVNYQGVEDMLAVMSNQISTTFQSQAFATYTVNGKKAGLVKNAGNFSYLRVSGAGHEVPAYQNAQTGLKTGEAAFQMFTQTMAGGQLIST